MEPCVESDFSFDFTECDVWTGERMEKYYWKMPQICDHNHQDSVKLPEDKKVPCRGCGRGQFRNSENKCEYCEAGFYQDIDDYDNSIPDW